LAGTEPVGVSDLVLSGFARIVTNHRIFRDPSTPSRAFDSCAAVCSAPAAVPTTAGPGTGTSFAKLCRTVSARANVILDAYLAALALELAESCDVPADWSCRTGVCHRCQTALIAGQVTYDPAPVDPLGPGRSCCAVPDPTPTSSWTCDTGTHKPDRTGTHGPAAHAPAAALPYSRTSPTASGSPRRAPDPQRQDVMTAIHHRTATVDGLEVFYREAGSPQLPTVVLLHGFPTSSHVFRNLIPLLADRYHVIAPDHIGFGRSSAPAVGEFPYTFDALTDVHEQLLAQLDVRTYALYVQDYGAPIGWRLALQHPDRVTAIISQNGNAYTEGFVDAFWAGLFARAADPSDPGKEAAVRGALTVEKTRWQYENGVPDLSLIDPDAWTRAQSGLDRPGNDEIQLALFRDYASNPPLYPSVQEYFRTSQVPLLAVWGRNDEIFGPDGATAFSRDLPDAEVRLPDSGHFALEDQLDTAAHHINRFLDRVLTDANQAPSRAETS